MMPLVLEMANPKLCRVPWKAVIIIRMVRVIPPRAHARGYGCFFPDTRFRDLPGDDCTPRLNDITKALDRPR